MGLDIKSTLSNAYIQQYQISYKLTQLNYGVYASLCLIT